jgi:hypothetical protein
MANGFGFGVGCMPFGEGKEWHHVVRDGAGDPGQLGERLVAVVPVDQVSSAAGLLR